MYLYVSVWSIRISMCIYVCMYIYSMYKHTYIHICNALSLYDLIYIYIHILYLLHIVLCIVYIFFCIFFHLLYITFPSCCKSYHVLYTEYYIASTPIAMLAAPQEHGTALKGLQAHGCDLSHYRQQGMESMGIFICYQKRHWDLTPT